MVASKNRNFGGSGAKESTTMHYVRASHKSVPVFKPKEINHHVGKKMSEEELEAYLSKDALQCLECGSHYKNLALHLFHTHLLSKQDYLIRYGMPLTTPLAGQKVREGSSNLRKNEFANFSLEQQEERREKMRTINSGKNLKKLRTCFCPQCSKKYKDISGIREALCASCLEKNRKDTLDKFEDNLGNRKAICLQCNKGFTMSFCQFYKSLSGKNLFCSKSCASKHRGKKRTEDGFVEKNCLNCDKLFRQKISRKAFFCSRECYLHRDRSSEGKFKSIKPCYL